MRQGSKAWHLAEADKHRMSHWEAGGDLEVQHYQQAMMHAAIAAALPDDEPDFATLDIFKGEIEVLYNGHEPFTREVMVTLYHREGQEPTVDVALRPSGMASWGRPHEAHRTARYTD